MSNEYVAEQQKNNLSSLWRTAISTVLLVAWVMISLLVYLIVKCILPNKLASLYMLFHRGSCWIFSMRCHIYGKVSEAQPTLYLCNHVSYLDVFVLGSSTPGYFIAKSEVAGWPILGWLAKLQNTLFFERKSRKVKEQLKVMSDHFNKKGNLILFPEGTSTEGEHVEPFKSSLLQSIEGASEPVTIQPVTLAYTHYKNQPMTRLIRDHYAWYATMPFASHFFSALGMAKSDVSIIFHEPVSLDDFGARKECAAHCWKAVADGLEQAIQP